MSALFVSAESNISPWIPFSLIVAGFIVIVIAILGSVPHKIVIDAIVTLKGTEATLRKWQIIVFSILGVVALILGLILAVRPEVFQASTPSCPILTHTSSSPPAPYAITSPENGSCVYTTPTQISVHGKAPTNISPGKELWLLVKPSTVQGYFPQSDAANPAPIVVTGTGQWNQFAFIGGKDDPKGTEYILYLALVDKNSDAQARFKQYFDDGLAGKGYNAIRPPLPQGIQIVAEATVIRA